MLKFEHCARKIVLVMVGLDNAGKTSTVKGIVGQIPNNVAPTMGFASFHMKKKFDITIYDLGGGASIRGIWKNYLAEAMGFIFVIDATDSQRFKECESVLHDLLKNPAVSGKPLLVLANKQDVNGALDELEISQILDIETIVNEVKCRTRVEMCSAIKRNGNNPDRGILTGFRWLLATIEQDYNSIQERVTNDVALQKDQEEKERVAREERIRKLREERAKSQGENGENEIPPIKEDPFKPITDVVKNLNAKESKQINKDVAPFQDCNLANNNVESRATNSANKRFDEIISNNPFENDNHNSPLKNSEFKMFNVVGPPGSIIEDENNQNVVRRQSTIEDTDDQLSSPNYIPSSEHAIPKKKLFRRKNKTAPLPPVQQHSMVCDLPPLSPIKPLQTNETSNGILSWGLAEELETSKESERKS